MELGIQLSFVKTSEFRGGGEPPSRYATAARRPILVTNTLLYEYSTPVPLT
jgi:hypothetical protein